MKNELKNIDRKVQENVALELDLHTLMIESKRSSKNFRLQQSYLSSLYYISLLDKGKPENYEEAM